MKVAISVPGELHEAVDRLAARRGLPRSQVYADAAREYLLRHDPDAVTAALDRVHAEPAAPDPALAAAAARLLHAAEW